MADLFIKNKTLLKCYNIENVILSVTLSYRKLLYTPGIP